MCAEENEKDVPVVTTSLEKPPKKANLDHGKIVFVILQPLLGPPGER